MNCAEIVSFVKDAILGCVAIAGVYVANKGLNTWKHQLKGQSEYELSRRTLITIFKYRDAIAGVRHPLMLASEMRIPPLDEAKKMTRDELQFYGTSKAYQTRWDRVRVVRTTLDADVIEGEVIWGDEIKTLFRTLFNLENELFTSIRLYLELIDPEKSEDRKNAISEIYKKRRDILYDDYSDEGDGYKNDFQNGVDAIARFLKPKLQY